MTPGEWTSSDDTLPPPAASPSGTPAPPPAASADGWTSTDETSSGSQPSGSQKQGQGQGQQQSTAIPVESMSHKYGITSPWLGALADFPEEAGASVIHSLHGLNQMIPGAPQVIPDVRVTDSKAGGWGKTAEQAAEWLLPAGKIGEGEKALVSLAEKAPVLTGVAKAGARAVAQGVPAAIIGGAQSGDAPGAMAASGIPAAVTAAFLPSLVNGVTNVLGATTGVGANVVRRALGASKDLIDAMEGRIGESDILQNARDALSNAVKQRGDAYAAQLQQISQNAQPLTGALKSTRNELIDWLQKQGVKVTWHYPPNSTVLTPQFNFQDSGILRGARETVGNIINDVWNWGDASPLGIDRLKRNIAGYYQAAATGQPSMQAAPRLANEFSDHMADHVRQILTSRVPGYQQMTQAYAEASKELRNLGDLSLGSVNDGTAMRKLMTALHQRNNYRAGLLDLLNQYAPQGMDLPGQIAGNALSQGFARGIAAPLHAAGLAALSGAGVYLHGDPLNPLHSLPALMSFASSIASASPYIVGRAARVAGKLLPYGPAAAGMTGQKIHELAVDPNWHPQQEPDWRGNTGQTGGFASGGSVSDIYTRPRPYPTELPPLQDWELSKDLLFGDYDPPEYARGGKVRYDDGGTIQIDPDTAGQFYSRPIILDAERAKERLFDTYGPPPVKAAPAPALARVRDLFDTYGPGADNPPVHDVPSDTSFSEAMSQANPYPEWLQHGIAAVNQPFSMPTTGGSPMSLADMVAIPQSKTEAALLAAGVLVPPAKALKGARGALKAGTALLEGAEPEVGALGRALEAAPRGDVTAEEVLQNAAQGPGKFGGFASYMQRNPTAGENLFDISNPQPSVPGRSPIARYDPSVGRGRGPSARIVDAFNNPKVIEGLKYYVNEGAKQLPEDWYANDPLYKIYQQEWGPQAEEKFLQQMGYQAATSTGSAVPDNLRTGSLYNYMAEQGIPFPEKPPAGYGSKYQVAHRDTALDFLNTGGVDPIANPKRASFTENLMGNEDLLTGDKHFMRLVGILSEDPRFLKTTAEVSREGKLINIKPQELYRQGKLSMADAIKDPQLWVEAPNPNEYLHMENQFRDKVAKPLGYTVANAQGKAWLGGGGVTGLGSPPASWINLARQRIQYTADRLNVDPQVVLRKFVRGEIPLLEIGGAAAGLGALGSMTGQGQASGTDRNRTDGRP